MYDVEKFTFNRNKCWFRNNCSMWNTENCNCACKIYFQYYYLVNLANIPENKQQPQELILQADDDRKKYQYLNKVKDNINNIDELKRLSVNKCIGCGICSYVCPAKINLREYVEKARSELNEIHKSK